MRIKNIRQFRSRYKEDIREIDSSNRNEHFVGVRTEVEGKSQYGFFEIYHGDKEGFNESDGIRGFLEGFLDMAKDGQAVYEFMQNAVDACSTKFCLFWGKDEVDDNTYLLVVNNGSMFNMDSIRSILNVGVSTKSSNNFTIGKFGIGFKLAHRLVGRENGLDELMHDNYGPILFSWQKNEINQLDQFIENPEVIPCNQEYQIFSEHGKRKAIIKTDEPWLFKILITNFPCQPENETEPEIIHDNQYNETDKAFSKEELQALGRWVQKHSSYLNNDFKEGALFFVRLGQGKQSHLEEDNLEEGVRFSLAILNKIAKKSLNHDGLKTVYLRGIELQPVQLQFETFLISKIDNNEEYRFLRFGKSENLTEVELSKEQADSDIEILLGFTDYQEAKDAFNNAPNFYLFFPLSEEKHKLRFILHSNAFYKSSSRTYLQKGSVGEEGINERLFRVFVSKLKQRMLQWVSTTEAKDKDKFLELYANLLLSNASDNPERVWVNEPLWQPILDFVRATIPVKDVTNNSFKIVNSPEQVHVKVTALPVDAQAWVPDGISWFYWDKDQDLSLYIEATSRSKLNVKTFSIIQLFEIKGIYQKINLWLNGEDEKIKIVLTELNELLITSDSEIKQTDFFKENLSNLKLWKFGDGKCLSIEEIADPETHKSHILGFGKIDELATYLKLAGFIMSNVSLSQYPQLFKYIQVSARLIKYFNDYTYLTHVLNHKFQTASFNVTDKHKILKLVEKYGDDRSTEDRIERVKNLTLFCNQKNQVIPLKQIIKSTSYNWLLSYTIKQTENADLLNDYLVTDEADMYAEIILPFWDEIISDQNLTKSGIVEVYKNVQDLHKKNPKAGILSDKKIVKVNSNFITQNDVYYYSNSLNDFTEIEYDSLKSVAAKLNIDALPAYEILHFYSEAPFRIIEKSLTYSCSTTAITLSDSEAKAFLKLCFKEDAELFKKVIIHENFNKEITITGRKDNVFSAVSNNSKVSSYIVKYHSSTLLLLPSSLAEFGKSIVLQGDKLINWLSDNCDFLDEPQLSELIEVVIESGIDARNYLVDKFDKVIFNLDSKLSPETSSVRFIQLLLSLNDYNKVSQIIRKSVSITLGNSSIALHETHLLGQNEIFFEYGEKKFVILLSSVLLNPDSNATKIVGHLTDQLTSIILCDKSILDSIFGLSGQTDKTLIYKTLQADYKDKPLDNAHQLAFLMHYSSQQSSEVKLDTFKVSTKESEISIKGTSLYASDKQLNYIPENLVLHSRYNGLSEILFNQLPYFKTIDNTVVFSQPYFENNRFVLPGISKIVTSQDQLEIINLLFANWKADSEKLKIIELNDKKNWLDIIGFDPNSTIVGSNLVLPSEELPVFIDEWLKAVELESNNIKDRKDFLRALGVSLTGSDIVRIRKYLFGEETIAPGINYSLPEKLVWNSLALLETQKCKFNIEGAQIELLKQLYNRLPESIDTTRLPLPIIDREIANAIMISKVDDARFIEHSTIHQLSEILYEINQLPKDVGKPIIYASLFSDITKLKKNFQGVQIEFDVLDTEAIAINGVEWNRNFYKEWKSLNPVYKIVCYPGSIPYVLTLSGKSIHHYVKNEIVFRNNVIIVNNEKNDKSIISLIETKNYLPALILQKLRELFNQYDDSVQDFMNRIQSNQKLREEFEKLQHKERVAQKKKELSEDFGNSRPYTMSWFMNLLELMVMSGGGKDLANPQGNIVFNEIKYDPSDLRLITLANPSKTISPAIDLFTDFKATFHYIDENEVKRSKQIQISGLSKKGYEVIAIPTNPNDLNGINLSRVIEVELAFVRILDLINKLTNAFRDLNLEESYNLKTELTENINFIFGPPGTGKTTEISRQVIDKILTGKSKNILILTPTNNAADVLVKRIIALAGEETFPENWLCRFGASTDLDLSDQGLVYDGNSFKFHLFQKCVMVTTIQRFPYEKVITSDDADGEVKTRISEIAWDTIIFDEASMIMLPAIVYPLYKRKFKRYDEQELTEFIVGGDPLQIPPIYDITDIDLGEDNEDVKEENIYTMVGLNSFDEKIQATIPKYGSKIQNLPIQYRSIEPIGTIFSKFQYNGDLEHGRNINLGGPPNPRPLPELFSQLGFKPVTIIRYPVDATDALYNPQRLNGSPFHLYSAFLINELILKFRKEATDNWNIGVVSPYRSQATVLNRLLESHRDKTKLNIVTDTVHGFQGSECDLIFAVFNPSSVQSQFSRLLKKEFIINVAVSRARDYLFIFIPDEDNDGFKNLPLFSKTESGGILNIIEHLPVEQVAHLEAGKIERALMGKPDFFQKHSLTNAHQDVNIYSDLLKDYIVRVSGNALDIHFKMQ
jgi:hypothetical protein